MPVHLIIVLQVFTNYRKIYLDPAHICRRFADLTEEYVNQRVTELFPGLSQELAVQPAPVPSTPIKSESTSHIDAKSAVMSPRRVLQSSGKANAIILVIIMQ